MPRPKQVITLGLIVSLALLPVSAAGAGLYLRLTAPPISGHLTVPGLQAHVEVVRDRWGIPHIYAQSEDDLFFAQGYVQAQDRLWQMDLCRRAAHGTLAEVFGERALAADWAARVLGFTEGADRDWAALDQATRQVLEAYAAGVNSFIAAPNGRLPVEFTLLDYKPQPWRPLDTLAWARLWAWSQSGDWSAELVRARLVSAVGAERAARLDPVTSAPLVVPAELEGLAVLRETLILESVGQDWPWFQGSTPVSMCCVVGAATSATGAPILASALQSAVQMPSSWYEMHLTGGPYDVIGATLPGLPGVLAGRNRSIAWSSTGGLGDVEDLYVERLRPGNPPQALYGNRWEDVTVRDEVIRVRGQPEPVLVRVLATRHGPLVGADGSEAGDRLALRWAGAQQPCILVQCLLAANRAAGCGEYLAALRPWTVPAQGMVCADAAGNVAHVSAASLPRRTRGDGRFPVPAWTGELVWDALVPTEPIGTLYSPVTALVAAGAALATTGPPLTDEDPGAAPYPADRARELLRERAPITLDDMGTILVDQQGPQQPLLQRILELPPRGWLQERTAPHLRGWDLCYDSESAGAGVFEVLAWRLAHNTLDDELGPALVDAYLNLSLSHGMTPADLAQRLLDPWLDDLRTPARETGDAIVARSYAEAIDWLGRRFGDLPYEWNWGRVHNVTFRHPLGWRWPLTLLLNRGAMRLGGGAACVNAAVPDYRARLAVGLAPTYRLVVDVRAGGKALAMNATGQSGDPFSPHYADMVRPWRDGRYHPLIMEREEVLRASEGSLTLAPLDGADGEGRGT